MTDAVVVDQADEKDWDLDKGMTVVVANESCLRAKFCELQAECGAMHATVSASLSDVV